MYNYENFNDITPGYYWFYNSSDIETSDNKIIKRIVEIVEFKLPGPYRCGQWVSAGKYALLFGSESLNRLDYLASFGDKKCIRFIPVTEPESIYG
jgi:hypothetical protein